MENDRQKWVNLSFIASAALLAWILFMLLNQISAANDLEARIRNMDWIIRGVSIGVGAIAALILFRSDQANQFMHETIVELGRVTWPARAEASKATIVVVVFVIVCSLLLGSLDTLWAWMLSYLV
jgi:preprotein translocase SecE subunit